MYLSIYLSIYLYIYVIIYICYGKCNRIGNYAYLPDVMYNF